MNNDSAATNSNEIHIEVCQNCRLHRWCTRHDEKKYNLIFENVSKALTKELGSSYKILKNINNPKPRIGAFEVTFNDKIIFSKIKNGCFPDPNVVALKAKEIIIEGKSGEKKEEEKKLEANEKKSKKKALGLSKPKEPDSKIPKYDIICASPIKINRAYQENEGFNIEESNVQKKN
jgi:selT/selW/selH-like putative selenoprotein